MAVYPTNDPALVDKLGEIFNVNLDTIISLDAIDRTFITRETDRTGCPGEASN